MINKLPRYKVSHMTFEHVVDLSEKVNEIIDYLSEKEEASKGECTCYKFSNGDIFRHCLCPIHANINVGKTAMASSEDNAKSDKTYVNCNIQNPPQQEESRGEWVCDCHEKPVVRYLGYIGYKSFECAVNGKACCAHKPQLKEESPKEDEWEDDFEMDFYKNYYGKHGQGFKKLRDLTIDYIKANFVSKVKVNKEISIVLESEACEYDLAAKLLKNLGLEEL